MRSKTLALAGLAVALFAVRELPVDATPKTTTTVSKPTKPAPVPPTTAPAAAPAPPVVLAPAIVIVRPTAPAVPVEVPTISFTG